MLTLADWSKFITDEKGRALIENTAAAMARGWPLLGLMPWRPAQGQAYIANFLAASAEAATRAMGAAFVESAPGVSQYTFTMRAAGGQVKLDINQIDADTTGVLRGILTTQKLRDIGARLFYMQFHGDKADAGGAQWTGFNKFCLDNSEIIYAAADGAVVTSDMMDDLLQLVPGANVILANRTQARRIDALSVGITKTVNLSQGGLSPDMFVQSYKGIPILPVSTAPDDTTAVETEILPQTEVRGNSGAVCSRITAARVALDGVFGIQNSLMKVGVPYRIGVFEYIDVNWFMAGLATDKLDAIAQLAGVKAA